jgi:hypothetical protein
MDFKKSITIAVIFISVLAILVLFLFYFPFIKEEIPKIVEEKSGQCFENYTSKRILLEYKNTTFSFNYCIFSSEEEATHFLNLSISDYKLIGFNFTEKFLNNFKVYEYEVLPLSWCANVACPPEKTGILFKKNNLLIFCGSFSQSITDNEYVCKWYTGEYLK